MLIHKQKAYRSTTPLQPPLPSLPNFLFRLQDIPQPFQKGDEKPKYLQFRPQINRNATFCHVLWPQNDALAELIL